MKLNSDELDSLQDACDDEGVDLRTEYSGRGMYGKTCIGIVADGLGALMRTVHTLSEDSRGEALAEAMRDADPATDSMGMSTIYYWRSLTSE